MKHLRQIRLVQAAKDEPLGQKFKDIVIKQIDKFNETDYFLVITLLDFKPEAFRIHKEFYLLIYEHIKDKSFNLDERALLRQRAFIGLCLQRYDLNK